MSYNHIITSVLEGITETDTIRIREWHRLNADEGEARKVTRELMQPEWSPEFRKRVEIYNLMGWLVMRMWKDATPKQRAEYNALESIKEEWAWVRRQYYRTRT